MGLFRAVQYGNADGKGKEKYADIIAHSENVAIRQFKVLQRYDSAGPRDNVAGGKWEVASPVTVPGFSAVAYFFAREINEQYHVPVGLINAAVAGGNTSAPAADEAWLSSDGLRAFPDGLFNGMIAPLTNYTIKGVLWYQGEANVEERPNTSLPSLR